MLPVDFARRVLPAVLFQTLQQCWRMIVERGQLQFKGRDLGRRIKEGSVSNHSPIKTQGRSRKTLLAVQRQRSRKPNQRRHCFQPLPNQDPRQVKEGNNSQVKTQDKSRKALPANLNKEYQTPPFGELQEHLESCLKEDIQLWNNGAFIICTAR